MYFKNKTIYCIGIGGIGMSGIAMFLNEKGVLVSGSNNIENKQLKKLDEKGINYVIGHKKQIPNNTDIVIYTEAINKEENSEYIDAINKNIEVLTYRQALAKLTKDYRLISITGTHGKTTTTSLLISMLLRNKIDINAIVGTNIEILDNKNYKTGSSNIFILETCEFNSGFLDLEPEILAITNIELDHFDSFSNLEDYIEIFQKLAENTKERIIVNAKDKNSEKLEHKKKIYFNTGKLPELDNLIGEFNQENADCALKIAEELKLNEKVSRLAAKEFNGIQKRMEVIKDNIYADYAHHPTAIKKTLEAVRKKNKGKKICVYYQPHQYSRTIALIKDFNNCFQNSDKVVITDIYECRDTEEDKKRISVESFIGQNNHKEIVNGNGIENSMEELKKDKENYDIVIIMGAGNICKMYENL